MFVSQSGFAEALHDPTKPPEVSKASNSVVLVVNQIIDSPERKLAVINDTIVHEGDIFEDAKVVTINENTVELQGPNGIMTLVLLDYPIKPTN